MLSQRARRAQDVNSLDRLLAERRAQPDRQPELLDLTASNPTAVNLPYPAESIRSLLTSPAWDSHEPTALGLASARREIAAFLRGAGLNADPERMFLTASTSESYAYLFKLLCDPGEAVLVPEPSYPLLSELARYESVRLLGYPLHYSGTWDIDFAVLVERLPEARAIIVVSPNNPTGSVLSQREFRRLASYGLPLIVDEVFWPYALASTGEPSVAQSVLSESNRFPAGSLVFRLDGLSKLALLPQLKLAWTCVCGDESLVDEAMKGLSFILDTYLSVSAPVQSAAGALLDATTPLRDAVGRRLANNLACLDDLTAGTAVNRLHTEAGWYAICRLPQLSDVDWAYELLDSQQLLVQPGWLYDMNDARAIVVSLLTPPTLFRRGVERLLQEVQRRI